MYLCKTALCLFAALALTCSRSASAQYSLSVYDFVGAGQDYSFLGTGVSNATGAAASYTDTQSWTGKDSHGNTQTMTLTGTAFGSAEFGRLHASASATLFNPYYNASNPVFFDGFGAIDPNGSPAAVEVEGRSGYKDTFTYTGFEGTGYKVRYIFHIDGLSDGDFNNFALVNFRAGGDPTDVIQTSARVLDASTASHDVTWGVPFTIENLFYAIDTQLLDNNNPAYVEGQTLRGSADYSATMVLSGIQIVDAGGNQVNGWGFESASGTHYNLLGGQYGIVPEPGSIALLTGMCVTGANFLRRRVRR